MDDRLQYGTPAKVLHWLVVVLLAVQFPIGWFMPDVHAGPPGRAMTLHISFGLTILMLILVRLLWRITHPVAPESSLPPWQRVSSGSCPLAALSTGSRYNYLGLAVRIVSRMVGVLFPSHPIADAGGKKPSGDPPD